MDDLLLTYDMRQVVHEDVLMSQKANARAENKTVGKLLAFHVAHLALITGTSLYCPPSLPRVILSTEPEIAWAQLGVIKKK